MNRIFGNAVTWRSTSWPSTGKARMMKSDLLDPRTLSAPNSATSTTKRWHIKEAFKRLKHRLNLAHVSAQSQQAAMHDFAAQMVCDNSQALATEPVLREAAMPPTPRINRAAAHSILKLLLAAFLLGADITARLIGAIQLIADAPTRIGPASSNPSRASPDRNRTGT